MKRVILLLFISVSVSDAQLVEENFDYIAGVLTAVSTNWIESPTGSTDIQIFNENLFFSGYQSSNIGNLIMLDGGASGRSGINRTFAVQSTAGTTIYWSFLLNVTSTAEMDSSGGIGDYFSNFQNSTMTQNKSYLYLKQGSDSSKYCIGLAKASSVSLIWHEAELNVNTTYLIVAGYSIVSGTGNDISKLWINPALTGDEPAADLTVTAVLDNISAFVLEQNFLNPFNPSTII
ncbi:MAG: hypothetical protein WC061_03550 [Melioribacteraceae bacterium]